MKMNWFYKSREWIEQKFEGVFVILSLPVIMLWLFGEWLLFEQWIKLKQKVARLFKLAYNME